MLFSALPPDLRRMRFAKGRAVACVFAEDRVELASTIAHLQGLRFGHILVFGAADLALPITDATVTHIAHDWTGSQTVADRLNQVIRQMPVGAWLYYCYNAEYLFFPFSEQRSIGEVTQFAKEERRPVILNHVIDLYARDLTAHPNGVCCQTAQLDTAGYYGLVRYGEDGLAKDRQTDVFGGLRRRFEEHVPYARRRIDRPSLFRISKGLRVTDDLLLSDPEANTFACPWHHSLTAATCSFRVAKALRHNPGSRAAISGFSCSYSARFEWTSQQLMDLGMIEPGQWF